MQIIYQPIGTLYSPFKQPENMPVQPADAEGIKGTVSVKADFLSGLKDLAGFSHLYLLYHFHQAGATQLSVPPVLDQQAHGMFATCAPQRPNPIGLSVVKLNAIVGNLLQIENVDILNGTSILHIKPYVPELDQVVTEQSGWLNRAKDLVKKVRADERFG